MTAQLVTADTSVVAKWFRDESGSAESRELLERHRSGELRLVLASHVLVESVAVVVRSTGDTKAGQLLLRFVEGSGIVVLPSDGTLIEAALREVDALGCTFYDAFAPAVATLVGAVLWSADQRAHSGFAGVELIG